MEGEEALPGSAGCYVCTALVPLVPLLLHLSGTT